jgi:ABC-type transport system substrate-binding protein
VQFSLHEPRPWLLEAFTAPPFVIYSHKSLAEHNNDLRKVIAPGTGPFVFKEHQVAERWLLTRNPHYWNAELPYVNAIEMRHIPAWTDRGTAVLTGKADFSWNVSMETYQEGVKLRDIVGTAQLANFGAYDVQINNSRKPFDDVRVRRAIHLAVSRQALMKAFETQEPINLSRWMSSASPFATPTSELEKLPGYRADKAADIAAAKKLLAETAVPNGFKDVDLLVASVPPHAEILASPTSSRSTPLPGSTPRGDRYRCAPADGCRTLMGIKLLAAVEPAGGVRVETVTLLCAFNRELCMGIYGGFTQHPHRW